MYIPMQSLGSQGAITQQDINLAEKIKKAVGQVIDDVSSRNEELTYKGQNTQERQVEEQIVQSLQIALSDFPSSGLLGAYTSEPLYQLHATISNVLGLVAPYKNLNAHIDNAILRAVPQGMRASTLRDLQEATYMLYLAKARELGESPKDYVKRLEKPTKSVNTAPTAGVDTPKPDEGGIPWWVWVGGAGLVWFFWPRRR